MNNRGFTLTEVLVVITLIGILSAIATFEFSKYTTKSSIENQTKLLYGDLMEYRIKALYEKRNWTFKIAAGGASYGIYSSAETSVAPVSTVTLKHPVTFYATTIKFDSYGVITGIGSVCAAGENSAAVDSIVVSMSMVRIGKRKEGETCVADKIDAK